MSEYLESEGENDERGLFIFIFHLSVLFECFKIHDDVYYNQFFQSEGKKLYEQK